MQTFWESITHMMKSEFSEAADCKFTVILYTFIKQECIPVGYVKPTRNCTAGGGSTPWTETHPGTETPVDRDTSRQRHPGTETLLDRDPPWTETPLDRDPPWTETPQTETPLDRDPPSPLDPGQRPHWTETHPGRRPPWTETPPCEQNHRQV